MVGARVLSVGPERLERWLDGFAVRHGEVSCEAPEDPATAVTVRAADGAVAVCEAPFPPMPVCGDRAYAGLLDHALRDRRVGVVLVRRGGYAAGVFDGTRLVASKVGSRHVQGRTAAGGWSQQRFARRRDKQAKEAFGAAADVVARILLPYADTLEAVVLGGDRKATAEVLADRRLRGLVPLVAPRHLDVPDPKLAVLTRTPERFRAVRIELSEPVPDEPTERG